MRLVLIPLLFVIYLTQTEANGRGKRSIATGRGSFRPAKRDIDAVEGLDGADETEKTLMAIGHESFLADKRSLALGRNNFRPGKRMHTQLDEVDKRSLALGRNNFRPGKRDYNGEEEDDEETTVREEKRSAALGRFNFRPGKRSLALGRINFRPGKRSLALGRSNFRPGKRAMPLACSYQNMVNVAENAEYLFALLEVRTYISTFDFIRYACDDPILGIRKILRHMPRFGRCPAHQRQRSPQHYGATQNLIIFACTAR